MKKELEQYLKIQDLFSIPSEDLKTELNISDNELGVLCDMSNELFLFSAESMKPKAGSGQMMHILKLHNDFVRKRVKYFLDFQDNETEKTIARSRIAKLLREEGVYEILLEKAKENTDNIRSWKYFLTAPLKLLKLFYRTNDAEKSKSPENLLFLAALFIPSNIRETSLGDMEEIYEKDVKRFGVKKAKWLMFKDIVVSNYPIMKEFARKSAIKIVKFAGVYEAVRRIIG